MVGRLEDTHFFLIIWFGLRRPILNVELGTADHRYSGCVCSHKKVKSRLSFLPYLVDAMFGS